MKILLIVLIAMASVVATAQENKITKSECLKRKTEVMMQVEDLAGEVFKLSSSVPADSYEQGIQTGIYIGMASSIDSILKDTCNTLKK